MGDFQFNPLLLRIGAMRRLQDAINRPRPEGSGVGTWAAPLVILVLLAIVGVSLLLTELAPLNKGVQRVAMYPAAVIVLLVFIPLFIVTHFLPKPQAWVRWTVWSLTVFGLQAGLFAAVLSFGLANRQPAVAGLIIRLVGWSLIGIATFSVFVLLLDLWRQKRMTEITNTAKR